ncbi:MAG: hypothetical protein H0V29_08260 [Thermoleophilaceae bacterium]|nr:hypothetical protein [Thermoleophilaceae bacterium]
MDVDGVISLFGFQGALALPGAFHTIDGIPHCIGHDSGGRVKRLHEAFEMVWATGWEEKANEYLPLLLDLPERDYHVLSFDGRATWGSAHWKLDAIDEYAGSRPAAWVDDNLDEECEGWAARREAPTLLVRTEPATGISDEHVERLLDFARRHAGT